MAYFTSSTNLEPYTTNLGSIASWTGALSTLLKEQNSFVYDSTNGYIKNGSLSDSNSEDSHYWVKFTLTAPATLYMDVEVGSEANYDYGCVSISKKQLIPPRTRADTFTIEDGVVLCNISGTQSKHIEYDLEKGVTYYVNFNYQTDGSNLYNGNIFKIKTFEIKSVAFSSMSDLTPYTTDLGTISSWTGDLPTLIKTQGSFIYNTSEGIIKNGPRSYFVDSGISHYWIKFTASSTVLLVMDVAIGSESRYDFGSVSISTSQLIPSRNASTVSNGTVLYNGADVGQTHIEQEISAGTYYININYQKDTSVNNNGDIFCIKRFQILPVAPKLYYRVNNTTNSLQLGSSGSAHLREGSFAATGVTSSFRTVVDGNIKYCARSSEYEHLILSATSGTVRYPGFITFAAMTPGNQSVSVSSGNTAVATVSVLANNVVTIQSVKPGSATITVTWGSETQTYTVTVLQGINNLALSETSGTIDKNGTKSFTVTNPSGGTLSVTPTSGNSYIVASISSSTVTVSGTSVTSAAQAVWVTSAATDYYESATTTYTCTVEQSEVSPNLTLSSSSGTITYPNTTTFTATRTGTGTLSVSSNNTSVATASINTSTGIVTVTSVKPGSATITVNCAAVTGYLSDTKTYSATISKGINNLSLSSSSGSIAWNGSTTVTITNPTGGTLSVTPTSNSNSYVNATISGTTLTITGRAYASSAQTITVTSAATDYYNSTTKTYSATITRTTPTLGFSATSGNVDWNGTTTFTITSNPSGGTLSVSSNATSYATAAISGSTVTITGVAYRSSAVTITVTSAANGNYNAATKTFTVYVKQTTPTLTLSHQGGIDGYQYENKILLGGNSAWHQINTNSSGTLSVSGNTSSTTATATITDNSLVISGTSVGQTTITVKVAASGNYTSNTVSITVTVYRTSGVTASVNTVSTFVNGQVTYSINNPNNETISVVFKSIDITKFSNYRSRLNGTTVYSETIDNTVNVQLLYMQTMADANDNYREYYIGVNDSQTQIYEPTINTNTKTVSSDRAGAMVFTIIATGTYTLRQEIMFYIAVDKNVPTLTFSKSSLSVPWNSSTTFTVTNPSGGALSVSSNATSYATASVSGNTVTVTGKAYRSSAVTITVNSAETYDYTSATKTISASVTQTSPGLSISPTSSTITYPNTSTVTVTKSGSGKITATSNATGVATISPSTTTATSTTFTITTVKPGSATMTFSCAASGNYSSESKTHAVTVNKAANTLTLSKSSASIAWNSSTTFTISTNTSGGTLSVAPTSNSNSYINATISGSTVTVTGRAYSSSAQTVTVTSAATDYYNSKTATCSITTTRTTPSVTLNPTSISVQEGSSATFTVTRDGSGSITISSNTSTATATTSVSGTTVTVNGVAAGTCTLTVKVAASGNYNSTTKTISVTVAAAVVELTWAQVKSYTQAGTLANYMSIGDAISVTPTGYPSGLSSSDYTQLEAVLMAINHNTTYEGSKNSQWYLRNKANSASSVFADDSFDTTVTVKTKASYTDGTI